MDNHLSIVLLGKAGVGKSASANTILGRAAFESEVAFTPVTKDIRVERGRIFETDVLVIDTPEILASEKQIKTFCQLELQDSRPLFLLVISTSSRFTAEDQKTVFTVIRVIGPQRLENCFLLFTGGDNLKTSLEDYIFQSDSSLLPDVVKTFSTRIHLFNNKDGGHEQVRQLLLKSGHLVETLLRRTKCVRMTESASTAMDLSETEEEFFDASDEFEFKGKEGDSHASGDCSGHQSEDASVNVTTEPLPPVEVTVSNISTESLSLQWDSPAAEVETFIVTCCTEGETVEELKTKANCVTFSNLTPGVCYSLNVSVQLKNGARCTLAEKSAKTTLLRRSLTKCDRMTESASTAMDLSETEEEFFDASDEFEFKGKEGDSHASGDCSGHQSEDASVNVTTEPLPPVEVTVSNISTESLSLQWDSPAAEVETFIVTCCTEGETVEELKTKANCVTFSNLTPGMCYSLNVSVQLQNGARCTLAEVSAETKPLPPVEVTVSNISTESLSLQWDSPAAEVETFIVTCCTEGETVEELTTDANCVTFSNLRPGVCYSLNVSVQLKNGARCTLAEVSAETKPLPPVEVTVSNISTESLSLQWDSPAAEVETFIVTCCTEGETVEELKTKANCVTFSNLTPGMCYSLYVSVQLKNGARCTLAEISAETKPLPPVEVTVSNISTESLSLQWDSPAAEVETFIVTCCTEGETVEELETNENCVTFSNLTPGVCYSLYVSVQLKNGARCTLAEVSAETKPLPPVEVTVSNISTESLSLQWDSPAAEVETFIVTCCTEGETVEELKTKANCVTFSNLTPGVCYSLYVSVQLKNGARCTLAEKSAKTKTDLEILLEDLRLDRCYTEKLSLSKILEIDEKTISDEHVKCKSDIPWYFLKKLMMVNVTARNTKCTSVGEPNCDDASKTLELNFDELLGSLNTGDRLNPLDIITALFLCSDGFVQQEMALKMSMCQFSVPLLLPNCDTTQCTLMLWAMRDIVKKYRPQHLLESKGFIEERIVHSQLPLISFVRLGECSLSKSKILNEFLSSSQQYHDTFVHHNMECGDSPRKISNGLTEITWYLPCGNQNMDNFVEPVAIANLHGDSASFETQFSFLCQTSAAVFVFFDNLDSGCELLMNQNHKAQIFLVGNHQNKNFSFSTLKEVATKLRLTNNNIIIKTKQKNDADFVKCLRESVSNVVGNSMMKMSVEQMADVARELGILVDEDSPECQAGKQNADAITESIQDILKYKEDQLPLQGEIWKELTFLEKEEFRLRKVGSENIEDYKSDLREQKEELRKKQNSYDMSVAMTCFTDAISSSRTERCYFLKWMRMNLDNLSCIKLSKLRELYKEKSKGSENKEEIKEIDRQLSNSSLGTEHFFREMGQIYEASVSLPETNPYRKQLQHLPKLGAQLLLDGFPLELVDGDASNIPLRWVSDVLSQLNDLVSPKNKITVVTVLGVQSTGKSTLLNTMFGVQFAVSSGRCTRGAFMLLIKVNEDIKKDLNCDFMVIIDTEGLKSPELAQLDNSHEHDNELATLVVGLSDITIINIAMENSTEMKDILQIVVHAFLRMKEVGKKPKCQFVHQNVSDVSAHEKNLRDRKLLLQQLNEMTQAAAKMEKKEENKSFTDVMKYNPDTGNCYVPGLWNGNPPMAPVNAGYSEAVYELKKNILHLLGESEASANKILEFREWMTSLWNAVKHENFIFSFRNSLVADAYMRLCTEFNKWEWEFKKETYTWVTKAETRISNFGTVAEKSGLSDMTQLLTQLKSEAASVLSEWETKLLDNLKEYFKQTEGHVYLVERYREDFANSAKSLQRELESSVNNQLTVAADIRRRMKELDEIKKNHTTVIEKAVCELIDECRKKKVEMTETELDKEFDEMWSETLKNLSFFEQKPKDVFDSVSHCLKTNLSTKGSHACELLYEKNIKDCGLEPYKCKADGTLKKIKNVFTTWTFKDFVKMRQEKADSIIDCCTQFVTEKLGRKCDYHDTYIQEILHIIDESLEKCPDMNIDTEFEVSLKQHICGFAARRFQKMHLEFLHVNDPRRCLDQNKEKFRDDFKDMFHERDQCQKKAAEFTEQCLKPAVEDFVNRSLGPDIIDEMLTKQQFSTRMSFQYSLLLDLLSDDKFDGLCRYCFPYESYVKEKILQQVKKHFSNSSATFELEEKHLQSRINRINDAIKHTKEKKCGDLKTFVEEMCKELGDKLVISQDALGAFMILNNADQDQFAHWLTLSVEDMAETLRKKFKNTPFVTKLKRLHVNPQNELFNRVVGCGKQCPFCKVPCDAGGKAHTSHFASLHRPEGLGRYRFTTTGKLVTVICTSSVLSDNRFLLAVPQTVNGILTRITKKFFQTGTSLQPPFQP
ncbi:interferon-induced very large GTPase 1-like isoform X2 [Melanotaenia boesemani]|uniref:interferon-induced very large GTPase 1-like isoform X2 n=1 Tax=Melanotaenia boesemani TaxID=1250792 RepID=UPI001C03DAAB|nr:interferon-induced very large GTPase 1-like isoform X2 [Melanotaenia boesemani]